MVVTGPAQTAAEKKPPTSTAKASPSKSGSKASSAHPKAPASAHAKAAGKHGKTTAKRGSKKSSSKAASWRSRQLAPTPERYKDIQSALAARGYLKQAPTGVWDGASTDALRRFQQDQNLEPSGKLNSLSLIALGLGAKHGGSVAQPGGKPAPAVITPQTPRMQSPRSVSPGAAPSNPAPSVAEPRVPDTASPAPPSPSQPTPSQPGPTPPTP